MSTNSQNLAHTVDTKQFNNTNIKIGRSETESSLTHRRSGHTGVRPCLCCTWPPPHWTPSRPSYCPRIAGSPDSGSEYSPLSVHRLEIKRHTIKPLKSVMYKCIRVL